jgi:hypothetical protein
VIGIHGSHKDAVNLKNQLTLFVKEELKMNLVRSHDKILITHATKGKANFLGYRIAKTPQNKLRPDVHGISVFFNPRPQLTAPVSLIVTKLKEAGFAKGASGAPTRKGSFIHYDLATIIEKYLLVARGILNYYSGCSNYSVLRARVLYILKYSCFLTFASKLKLRTIKKVIKKFGYDLAVDSKGKGSAKGSKGLKAYYELQSK